MDNLSFWNGLPNVVVPAGIEATSQVLNQQLFMEIVNRCTNIALSRFKWRNLPKTCNERALEMTLLFYGKCLFFEDKSSKGLGLIHTPVELTGDYNIYYESTKRYARSFNYWYEYGLDDSVLIRSNWTMSPDSYIIFTYATKIANALRAIDVHTETIKRPFAVKCEEKEKQSIINAVKNVRDNDIVVLTSKFLGDGKGLEVLNFNVEPMLSEMWANVKNYLNQMFNALGIQNQFTEKRERMIVSESEGEANPTRHGMQANLECRRIACKEINRMFNTHITVEANQLEEFTDERLEQYYLQYTGAPHGEATNSTKEGVQNANANGSE